MKDKKDRNQTLLYVSICFIILFTMILYSIDWLIIRLKPEWVKTNGKVDNHKKFVYTLIISFLINITLLLLLYQILA